MSKETIPANIYYRIRDISRLKPENIRGKLEEWLETVRPKSLRTSSQNRALHKWFALKAEQCRDAGIPMNLVMAKTIELDMSPEMMKEVYREVIKARYGKKSTTELEKGSTEIEDTIEHLNRFFAKEPFYLEGIEMPHDPEKKKEMEEMNAPPKAPDYEYPEEPEALADKF